ncbi:N-acetylmuramoyl-L-alanine amidase [Niallia alba]|uniref:N-acetylmuramoyl-L-alanine amidase n=1 Tax=Niallia alba TaxID=2729105 RepID=UPI0039A2F9AA
MSVKVKEMLVSSSKYNIKCPYSMDAEYITFHNTANDAAAENEIKYMIGNNSEVSYHFAVDDKEVVQGIPLNRNAWHTGDSGKGDGNRKSIGVEVCYSKSGGEKYEKAEALAIKFIAQLLHERNWGVDRVRTHKSWTEIGVKKGYSSYVKNCPHRVLDAGRWDDVLNAIEKELKILKGENTNEEKVVEPVKEEVKSEVVTAPSKPTSAKPSTSLGLVDWMKSKGMDSSYNNRAKLAKEYGIANYSGSASQNEKLLDLLQAGKKPVTSTTKKETTSNPKNLGLVDWMNANKMDSSYANREKLAKQYGISGYKGTADQNIKLLEKLTSGSKTSTKTTSSPTIKVEAKVTLKSSATKYATGESIPKSIKGKKYTIQQVGSGKVLLKEIYSWVKTSDLS